MHSTLSWFLNDKPILRDNWNHARYGRILAARPSDCANSGPVVVQWPPPSSETIELTGGGLRMSLSLHEWSNGEAIALGCGLEHDPEKVTEVPLIRLTSEEFARPD